MKQYVQHHWTAIGASLAGLAVIFGAFGAHGVDAYLLKLYAGAEAKTIAGFEVPAAFKYLQDFKTAAEYQMTHALGIIVCGLLSSGMYMSREPHWGVHAAGWCFLLGILFFSGSLYVLALTGQTWLGMVAPLGGTSMIVGWGFLAYGGCPCRHKHASPNE